MTSIHQQYVDALQQTDFAGDIKTDKITREAFATDESIFSIEPQIVLFPTSVHDLSVMITTANSLTSAHNPIHFTPRAAGTGLSGGSLNDSVIVDTLSGFNKIISLKKQSSGDVFITVQPGVYYRDLETEMDEHEVYIPSFPASKDICTIGGMVANNAAGPDTLKYGHTAEFVESMKVVLHDGQEYQIRPLEWNDFEPEMKRADALGEIYRYVWGELLHNEDFILKSRPHTRKNSAGYAMWDVISSTVEEFMKGRGTFDLGRLFTGSQGTLGIITEIVVRAVPKEKNTHLVAIPIFDLSLAGSVITKLLEQNPTNIEIFDDVTFNLALTRPSFFKQRLQGSAYRKMIMRMYSTFFFRFRTHIPEFTILATFADKKIEKDSLITMCSILNKQHHCNAWIIKDQHEKEMFWQIRRASYTLSKLESVSKRPAAFLEDMTVEPEEIGTFFADIKKLFIKYDVEACIHGHGGNGHLHFYPLLDFTLPETSDKIIAMSEDFFNTAVAHNGNICGEHNDGIIRTPYLDKIFSKEALDMFVRVEHACDPRDIFNPGKKVNPRFTITKAIRHTN